MQSKASTVEEYLASLPEDRRGIVQAVREIILENLDEDYEEGMQYGMIGYYVPLARYPDTYNGQPLGYLALANQKRYMSLYLMGVYGDAASDFRERYTATGQRLDMGKSCVRFRKLDQLPLDVIADEVGRLSVEQFIAQYEDARTSATRKS